MSGAELFARFAFPPNELGYCGPAGAEALLEEDEAEIAARARQFDGAWPYLEIIAAAAGIDDPLDARVVEAYWIGNELLELVDPVACLHELRSRFAGQVTSGLGEVTGAVPHHSFHVFVVYPWAGMLGRGRDAVALSVLEQCRIRWGVVTELDGERAAVVSEPLTWRDGELRLGPERTETVRWATEGRAFVRPAVGDTVALHWDWVCDKLSEAQRAGMAHWSGAQLGALRPVSAR